MASDETSEPGKHDRVPSGVPERKVVHIWPTGADEQDRIFGYQRVRELRRLCQASSGVCELTVLVERQKKSVGNDGAEEPPEPVYGTCFLGKFEVDDKLVFGLFTANHLVSEALLHNEHAKVTITNQDLVRCTDAQETYCRSKVVKVHESQFCFTCPVFDVTFIEFDDDMRKHLRAMGFQFLQVEQWDGIPGQELHLLHYPGALGDHDQYFSIGHFDGYNGLHLTHSLSTAGGSSGAPLLNERGVVVAIHARRSPTEEGNYNVAADATSVLKVLIAARREHCIPNPSQTRFVSHHPTKHELQSCIGDLQDLGLKMMEPEGKRRKCIQDIFHFFEHVKGLKVSDVQDEVPIYFVLTSHGWYWSDISPFDGKKYPTGYQQKRMVLVEEVRTEGKLLPRKKVDLALPSYKKL